MKYPNGYLPRIAYHISNTKNADKILYFLDRQIKQYGEPTSEELRFIVQECINNGTRPSEAIYTLTQAVDRLKKLQA